jgi:hypothetical protein
MGMTVWVDSWQMQCCGKPFGLGAKVAWTLGEADPDWLETVLGTQAQQAVDAAEDHHGRVPEDTVPTCGTVTRITAVHCRFAPESSREPAVVSPVSGSAVFTNLKSADGWTADRGDEEFVGYLVQIEP